MNRFSTPPRPPGPHRTPWSDRTRRSTRPRSRTAPRRNARPHLAARFPERVEAIVLLGTGGTPAHGSYRLLAVPGVQRALGKIGGPLYRSKLLRPFAKAATASTIRSSYAPDEIPSGLLDVMLAYFADRPDVLETMAALALGDLCGQVARQLLR